MEPQSGNISWRNQSATHPPTNHIDFPCWIYSIWSLWCLGNVWRVSKGCLGNVRKVSTILIWVSGECLGANFYFSCKFRARNEHRFLSFKFFCNFFSSPHRNMSTTKMVDHSLESLFWIRKDQRLTKYSLDRIWAQIKDKDAISPFNVFSIATLGSILDLQLSWKSCKFQLTRWSHKVVLFPEGINHLPTG